MRIEKISLSKKLGIRCKRTRPVIKIISVAIAILLLSLSVTQVAIASGTTSQLWLQYSDKTICRLAKTAPRTDGYFYVAALRGLDCKDVPSVAVTFPVSNKAVCRSNDSLKWHNCLGRLSVTYAFNSSYYETESVYIGEWLNGKYHGSGILINDRGIFVSEWQKGERTGLGRFWYLGKDPSGKPYVQSYFESLPSRRYQGDDYKRAFIERLYEDTSASKLVYLDGSVYRGEFYYDSPFGSGARTYPDGKVVSGTWKFGELKSKLLPSIHYRANSAINLLLIGLGNYSTEQVCRFTHNPPSWVNPVEAQLVLIMRGMIVNNCLRRNPSMDQLGGDPSKLLFTETNELVATTPSKPVPIVKKPVKPAPVVKTLIKPTPVTKPASVAKTAPKDDEVFSTSSSSGANKIFMICETEAMGERRVANGSTFHAEIDLDLKRLNWSGWESKDLYIRELTFFAVMEKCIDTSSDLGCILPQVDIDRLTGSFKYQTWADDGQYHGTCRLADKKKRLF